MPRIVSERLDGIFISSPPKEGEGDGAASSVRWPLQTDAACWNCAHQFNTQPIPIFRNYCSVRDVYEVWGHACSAACAKQFLLDQNLASSQQNITWQRQMMVDCLGWPCDKPLPCGRPWQTLKYFGGSKTIEEWRASNDPVVILTNHKFIPSSVIVQTHLSEAAVVDGGGGERKSECCSCGGCSCGGSGGSGKKKVGDLIAQAQTELTTLTGLKRPPEDKVIRTREQLQAAYPTTDLGINRPSVFQNYLSTQIPPTDEECAEMRRKLEQDTKLKRKRRHPIPEGAFDGPAPPPMVGSNAVAKKQASTKAKARSAQQSEAAPRKRKSPSSSSTSSKSSKKKPGKTKNKTQDLVDDDDCFRFSPPPRAAAAPHSPDYGPPRSPDYGPPRSPEYRPTPAGYDYNLPSNAAAAADADAEFNFNF